MGMGFHRLQDLDTAYKRAQGAVSPPGPLFSSVQQPELDGVHPQFFAQLVYQRLGWEGGDGRAGGTVGGCFGFVVHHVVAVDEYVGNVIGSEHTGGGAADGSAGISAGFEGQVSLSRDDAAVLGRTDLQLHVAATGGSGSLHNLDTA